MSMMNRMANCSNRFQGEAKKVLCVCSAGLLRSPTTANTLHKLYGYNTRAAGLSKEYALIPVDEVLLEWCDEVVVMEEEHKLLLLSAFAMGNPPPIQVLDIEDAYAWGDEQLIEMITQNYTASTNET